MTDGFLNLLKPPGMTSSDAVVLVRRAFARGTKVGHMGTLDPEAAGVLPIGVGSAARLFDYVTEKEKTYRAEIAIGQATDTQDATGRVVARGPGVRMEDLRAVLPRFVGEIEQVPPAYSPSRSAGASSTRRRAQARRWRSPAAGCRSTAWTSSARAGSAIANAITAAITSAIKRVLFMG